MENSIKEDLKQNLGISVNQVYYQLSPEDLQEKAVSLQMGRETKKGTLSVLTGKFTGRSPKDRYIVKDDITSEEVNWGTINLPFQAAHFDVLYKDVLSYLKDTIYVRDCFACASEAFKVNVRVVNEFPWSNLFVYNMFLRPNKVELKAFKADWVVINAPGFMANPKKHHTENENFTIINFTKQIILIGGTGYTGEIKKGIFSALNFTLPTKHKVLPMHCAANVGDKGDTAIFFGLSGTGKTTLSADANRKLIGDDEHGWSANEVFNFEGGCYAKVIGLTEKSEPEIYGAIKKGALLENVIIDKEGKIDFNDVSITQNTRVSYPIDYLDSIEKPSVATNPKNIFFLTADAFGVLPPISKLTKDQAAFYFISGYTAKIAGTENGIVEPEPSFSACFGAPFLPLNPVVYAEMLMEKLATDTVNVWLVNTGWTGGSYGKGYRIPLKHTRAMINAVLNGDLNDLSIDDYQLHPIFKLRFPKKCNAVPADILNPIKNWDDEESYNKTALHLANAFNCNFETYKKWVSKSLYNSGPIKSTCNNY
ncbi:MAG: phosphoenolpyruvate carboxykinase (ATP) [Galbibacter orientalis]|uniref:phosphoenolpyruvate carboxykinase (ATP) n=1 Tax=Galbibacter orientalis TaxID=453852 RepID=UPI003001125E